MENSRSKEEERQLITVYQHIPKFIRKGMTLIIDEAHSLVTDYSWRRETVETIQAGENVPYGYCLYCVGIWVIDSEKKILLTKRSSQKRYAPGKWENTGGHMISGETSRHAIVRELKEETGIQIEEDELIELGDNHIGQFLGDNYAVFKDVALDEVHLEEGETEDVIKVTLPQLEEMAEKKMLSPAVWDHMAGYKDEFYRLFD